MLKYSINIISWNSETKRQQNNLATLLFGISILFIVCQSFKMIPDFYELIYCTPRMDQLQQLCESTTFITFCTSLSHLLVCLNSSLNWVIYLFAGKKFRRAWCKTYLPSRCQSQSMNETTARDK